ncbi:MAG: glycosyltransferase [Gallionella sp.]|nr:glycosyltransferase [Gallionella sp.]
MTARTKIGFVLPSSARNPIPSTRIAVLNMLPFLRAAQFDPHIVFEPPQNTETPDVSGLATRLKAEGFRIVFFQKVHGASIVALAYKLRLADIKTVFGVCDVVEPAMVEATDATVTVTDYLKSLHPSALQTRISTVHDGIEQPLLHKTDWGSHSGSRARPLRAVLVTSVRLDRLPVLVNPPNWLQVTIVGHYPAADRRLQRLREARWQLAGQAGWREQLSYLRFLANPHIQRVAWNAVGVYDAMRQADIGIIPIETDTAQGALDGWQVKSENRLTLKMAVGLPVIATPIPAYEPVVRQGRNSFLARNEAEWLSYLSALRDPVLRRSIGQQARQTALAEYSMERQAEKLLAVLRRLV